MYFLIQRKMHPAVCRHFQPFSFFPCPGTTLTSSRGLRPRVGRARVRDCDLSLPFQHIEESILRDFYSSNQFHPGLAFLLFF